MGRPIYTLKKRPLLASVNGAFRAQCLHSVYSRQPAGSLAVAGNGPIKAPGSSPEKEVQFCPGSAPDGWMGSSPEEGGLALDLGPGRKGDGPQTESRSSGEMRGAFKLSPLQTLLRYVPVFPYPRNPVKQAGSSESTP